MKEDNTIRVGTIDIESSSLEADMGRVFSTVIKTFGADDLRVYRGDTYKGWHDNRNDDSEIVRDILADMRTYDILVGHNLTYFDLPYLNTRALALGIPVLPPRMLIDTVLIARRVLKLKYNSLDQVAKALKVADKKTPLDKEIWRLVMFNGDTKALDQIVEHNRMDVLVNEQVFDKLRPFIKQVNNYGSA